MSALLMILIALGVSPLVAWLMCKFDSKDYPHR